MEQTWTNKKLYYYWLVIRATLVVHVVLVVHALSYPYWDGINLFNIIQ